MSFTSPHDHQTIIAHSTPSGAGALALIRISGPDALIIANEFVRLPSKQSLIDLPSHTVWYAHAITKQSFNHPTTHSLPTMTSSFHIDASAKNNAATSTTLDSRLNASDRKTTDTTASLPKNTIEDRAPLTIIDHVMITIMRAPRTFTGHDTVEITCHNNPFIIQDIITQGIRHGARMAQPGEFTKQAFFNKKIDLLQAEAVSELIHANNQTVLKKSLADVRGSFSHWVHSIEQELITCLALSDASFEFLDDELSFGADIRKRLESLTQQLTDLTRTFSTQKIVREGVRIALIGAVNAGKSSLFNAITKQNRAIVSDQAGTTRDVIEAGLYHQAQYWTLVDTAGIRQTNDLIEQEGVTRSYEQAHLADIVLLIIDQSRPHTDQEKNVYENLFEKYGYKSIVVFTKTDLPQGITNISFTGIPLSCHNHENVHALITLIQQKIDGIQKTGHAPFLLNQRHIQHLHTLDQKLSHIMSLLVSPSPDYEIISYELKAALEPLAELTGKTINEQTLDTIFKEFCIGK